MTGSMAACPVVARCLLALSLLSSGALADDAATPASHWSGLPIWGAEAEARGYQIPLPFGIGVTAYSARQPVNIQDLQLGFNAKDPVSVKNFLQIDKVDTSQQNVSAKFDVLVFPFLDVYALLGYTKGTTKGLIQIPEDPILGIIEPRVLQLNASFHGCVVADLEAISCIDRIDRRARAGRWSKAATHGDGGYGRPASEQGARPDA